jgi:YggT family protein
MTALRFIVGTLLNLYILAYVLRFAMQWSRGDSRNPFWQFIVQLTNPLVLPLRRVVPGWRGLELVSPLLVLVLEVLAIFVLLQLSGYPPPPFPALIYYALLRGLLAVLRMYVFALFVYVLLSWISPDASHPLTRVLTSLCEPLLRPVRRVIPVIAGFDLSPLFVLIALQALAMSVPLPAYLD